MSKLALLHARNPGTGAAQPERSEENPHTASAASGIIGSESTIATSGWADTEDSYRPEVHELTSLGRPKQRPEPPPELGEADAERRSTQEYIRLARPLLVERLTGHVRNLAAHAGTPAAGLYALKIDEEAKRAVERFFDDGYLSLVLSVRSAICVDNAWSRYSAAQYEVMCRVLLKYAGRRFDNGTPFRKGVLELKRAGFITSPLGAAAGEFLNADHAT